MEKKSASAKVVAFSDDILSHGGYLYTTNAPLSSRLAHGRISDAIFGILDFRGKTVIDIGCGDAVFTLEVLRRGTPSHLHGTDLSEAAVNLASHKEEAKSITFDVASAYQLPFADQSYDIAHVRAVLHHMDYPDLAIKEALRVARQVVVAEPNGNNPGVKLFEQLSPYHREHQEKSYSSPQLKRWVMEAGGVITKAKFVGLVPTFCPDWAARVAKAMEPHVERTAILSPWACSIYVFVAQAADGAYRMRS